MSDSDYTDVNVVLPGKRAIGIPARQDDSSSVRASTQPRRDPDVSHPEAELLHRVEADHVAFAVIPLGDEAVLADRKLANSCGA